MAKTKLRTSLFVWFLLFISLFSKTLQGAPMYPKAESTYLNDFARMINEKDATEIKNALFNFRKNFHFPVVLVTVEDLGGEEVQIYATELANQWGIGEKGKSNGALLLFSREDRKVTLQLGRDIRNSIPTSDRERIIKNMISYFKSGDYSTGLKEGTRQTLEHLKRWTTRGRGGQKTHSRGRVPPVPVHSRSAGSSTGIGTLTPILSIALVLFGFIFLVMLSKFFGGGGRWGQSNRRNYRSYGGGDPYGTSWGSLLGGGLFGYWLGSSSNNPFDSPTKSRSQYDQSYFESPDQDWSSGGTSSSSSSWDTSSSYSSGSDSGGSDWGGGSFDGDGSSGSW